MWRYPEPGCHDRPFLAELVDAKVATRVRRILALRSSTMRVLDLVLGDVDGSSSLATSMSFSWISRSPLSPSCRTGWFTIVDVWDRSPLAVNEASLGLGAEEIKMPSPPHTISIVGPEWPLWLCLSSINSEALNYSTCSLGLQHVSIESHPFPPLILKLSLLRCL
jgi:hypothetical protein